jgi:hypothetical protein
LQILFLGSLSQYALAPVLWSFWLMTFGLDHPLAGSVPTAALTGLVGLFLASEALSIAVGLWAVRGPRHRHLRKWVPSLVLYFPLGALAAYKAGYEVLARPFFWDKTAHGICDTPADGAKGAHATAPLMLTDPFWPETDTGPVPVRRPTLRLVKGNMAVPA